jgi:hypothetical protein
VATVGLTPMHKVVQVMTGVAGSPYYVTGYFDSAVGTAQQAADAWRNFLSAGVSTYAAPLILSPITDVPLVDPATGDVTTIATVSVAGVTMTGAGDPLPPATSLLVRWRTGQYLDGREIRGRTNIPRLTETDNTAGVPSATTISTWAARIATMLALSTAHHVVWSKKNGAWATTVTGPVWNQWASLRSRRD